MPNQHTLKAIPLLVGAIFFGACAATAEPEVEQVDDGSQDIPEISGGTVSENYAETYSEPPPPPSDDEDGAQVCGNDADLHCCNSLVQQVSQDSGLGILNDLLGQVSLGSGCTPILSISQCSQKVACCDSETDQNGLINVNALNCVQVPLL